MNAVICGSAGIALLVEDDRLFSYDITSPETLVPRTPEEYSFLFAGSRDVEFLDDVSRDEVDRRLARAVARARALHLALLLIDGTWSAATRRAAAAELESLIAVNENNDYVQSVLYSLPLPAGEAVQSGLLLCAGDRTRALLGDLIKAQPSITEMRVAWEEAARRHEADRDAYLFARAEAVKSGLFRLMAAFYNRQSRLDDVEARAMAGAFRRVAGWHELLMTWAAPVQKRWQEINEIVAQYWGYLEQLRSPRPRVTVRGLLPGLAWPKPAPEPSLLKSGAGQPTSAVPDSPEPQIHERQRSHDIAVLGVNARIEDLAKAISRIRFWRRLPYWLYGAIFVMSLSVPLAFGRVRQMFVEVTTFAISIGAITAAVVVFHILNQVFASKKTLIQSIGEYQSIQAIRESFDLAWAASLAPVAHKRDARSSPLLLATEFLSQVDKGPDELLKVLSRPPASPMGGVRIVLGDVDGLLARAFTVEVDRDLKTYVGTNSVALTLSPGSHSVSLIGALADGSSTQAEMTVVITPHEIHERSLAFP